MTGVIIFNVFILAVGAGIASGIIPAKLILPLLSGLHNTVGVTMPTPDKVRMVALIWLAFVLAIVDGAVFLFVFLASRLT
jgi:hypothetical protein